MSTQKKTPSFGSMFVPFFLARILDVAGFPQGGASHYYVLWRERDLSEAAEELGQEEIEKRGEDIDNWEIATQHEVARNRRLALDLVAAPSFSEVVEKLPEHLEGESATGGLRHAFLTVRRSRKMGRAWEASYEAESFFEEANSSGRSRAEAEKKESAEGPESREESPLSIYREFYSEEVLGLIQGENQFLIMEATEKSFRQPREEGGAVRAVAKIEQALVWSLLKAEGDSAAEAAARLYLLVQPLN